MRETQRPMSRWLTLAAVGVAGALLLACAIPALSGGEATPRAMPTVPPPTPTPPTSAREMVTTIDEEEMNSWLQGTQTQLGEGVDCREMRVRIRSTGITLSARLQVEQLRGTEVPVDIVVRPVVRDEHLRLEVLDVQLGGPYASFSALIKPLVSAGVADGLDADQFLAEQGVRVSSVELREGSMVIRSLPVE